ncbi:hypothetical protein V8F33_008297 [Rhypophila sp. PSN 637]
MQHCQSATSPATLMPSTPSSRSLHNSHFKTPIDAQTHYTLSVITPKPNLKPITLRSYNKRSRTAKMDQTACCTCATLLSQTPRVAPSSSSTEKQRPLPDNRPLDCCGRVICGSCIHKNPRFDTYCPYCQTSFSSTPASFTPRGKAPKLKVEDPEEEVKEPPSYEDISSTKPPSPVGPGNEEPPPYTAEVAAETNPITQLPPSYDLLNNDTTNPNSPDQKNKTSSDQDENEPILHFLNHPNDTIQSLSLRYSIPAQTIRSFNRLSSDHLLLARQTILIPRQTNKSQMKMKSLSPAPVNGEEEQIRKNKIRRWMVTCKVHDYDVAVLYLEQAGYDIEAATEAYFADEAWERDHPFPAGQGNASSSSRETGGAGKWDKVRAYHQQRLNGRVPSSLLNIRPS